ncbi:hypothetical protein F2P81_002926 [Scophthalmus maximus]|uniref:Uncharacterized protein n=1 Tax=Scophthalmus maximus TaxID=52904 RepID=A0A6A4TH38_SCOMX|nr:hypothetical protein F2P81_002926 [Scophthalmus maximus]
MGESYQMHLYGRAPYEGLRRTLKKSPYLRLRSPAAPLSRRPRPRLVESIRGVKVKSCKTQTSLTPPLSPSPGRPQRPLIFSSSRMMSGDPGDLTVTPAVTYPVPIAILLGRRMVYSSSRLLAEPRQEVTSPPTPPYVFTAAAEVDGSDDRSSQREGQQDSVEAPPPCPPSHIVIEMKSNEGEEEENALPGTDFLSVADVVQEELSVLGEEAVELDGCPSPPAFQYQGPVFPPQAYSALLAQDKASVPDTGQRRDPLESRLVEWVEQQVMSRMILEMYPPPPCDPTQDVSTDQSESEEQSVTSDIVAAAGGGALQQFIDSNKCVDLALIRQLVNEVLTDIVASMLGQRDAPEQQPEPGLEPSEPAANQEDDPLPLVPTPIPTPPPSLTGSIAQTTPPTTPPPSEPTSLLNEECPQPIRAAELVTTPTPSLDPAPPTQSPPALHQAPSPLTWGDVELPLDEERPEEDEDPHHRQPLSSDDAVLKHISEGEMLIRVNQQATMTAQANNNDCCRGNTSPPPPAAASICEPAARLIGRQTVFYFEGVNRMCSSSLLLTRLGSVPRGRAGWAGFTGPGLRSVWTELSEERQSDGARPSAAPRCMLGFTWTSTRADPGPRDRMNVAVCLQQQQQQRQTTG